MIPHLFSNGLNSDQNKHRYCEIPPRDIYKAMRRIYWYFRRMVRTECKWSLDTYKLRCKKGCKDELIRQFALGVAEALLIKFINNFCLMKNYDIPKPKTVIPIADIFAIDAMIKSLPETFLSFAYEQLFVNKDTFLIMEKITYSKAEKLVKATIMPLLSQIKINQHESKFIVLIR